MKILVTILRGELPPGAPVELRILATGDSFDPVLDEMLAPRAPVQQALARVIANAELVAVSNVPARPGGAS